MPEMSEGSPSPYGVEIRGYKSSLCLESRLARAGPTRGSANGAKKFLAIPRRATALVFRWVVDRRLPGLWYSVVGRTVPSRGGCLCKSSPTTRLRSLILFPEIQFDQWLFSYQKQRLAPSHGFHRNCWVAIAVCAVPNRHST